jgi:ABC-type glycerol-3-phosphate transport system substrate-binding protein
VPEAQYIYNGVVFMVSLSNGPNFIYYRKDLFEDAGVEPPETIEDLLALPPAFEAIGVDTMVSGLDSTTIWQYIPWFYNIAGGIDYEWALDRQADECQTWTGDPVAEEALLTFERLYDEGVLRKQSPQERYDPDAKQAFIQAEAALQYTAGVWLNGGLADDIDNIGALYFPVLNAGDNPVLLGSNDVAVSILNVTDEQKDPAHQDLMLEFAKFISSPESQAVIWEVGLMPLMPEAISSEDTGAQQLVAEQVRMAAASDVNVLYYAATIPEVGQALGEGMLGMLIDVKTVDEVLADIDAACAAR